VKVQQMHELKKKEKEYIKLQVRYSYHLNCCPYRPIFENEDFFADFRWPPIFSECLTVGTGTIEPSHDGKEERVQDWY